MVDFSDDQVVDGIASEVKVDDTEKGFLRKAWERVLYYLWYTSGSHVSENFCMIYYVLILLFCINDECNLSTDRYWETKGAN